MRCWTPALTQGVIDTRGHQRLCLGDVLTDVTISSPSSSNTVSAVSSAAW